MTQLNQLLNIIAPTAARFDPRALVFGDVHGQVLVATGLPGKVPAGWLSRLATIPWCAFSMHGNVADPASFISGLNRTVAELRSRLMTGSPTAAVRENAERTLQDAEELMRQIADANERIWYLTIVLLVMGASSEELAIRVRQVESLAAANSIRLRTAVYSQDAGLVAAAPFSLLPPEIEQLGGLNMPSTTVAAAMPIVAAGKNDGQGIILGRDNDHALVLADRWHPGRDGALTNANLAILGASGSGKSFATKLYALREWALGSKIIIIDPEREYRAMADQMGGTWVNCAGGQVGINPMRARLSTPDADESRDAGAEVTGALSSHMQRLETFLGLLLRGLDDFERATLMEQVVQVYRDNGVTWTTDPASVSKWPTLRDLYDRLGNSRVAVLLRQAAEGIYSAMWSRDLGPDTSNSVTVLDIHDLEDAPETIKRAQYFNILGWAWDAIRADRHERKILIVDEAWLLIDHDNPQALRFMRELAKRIRKYGGSLWVATQNVKDFLAPRIAQEGEAVLANCATKLLLRQAEADLDQLAQMASMRLSSAERDLLATSRRGNGLLLAGNARLQLRIEASEAEREVIDR